MTGRKRYPGVKRLLILADAGGANDHCNWEWKVALQRLADEFDLIIRVTYYPPGASKWNPIDHRMFSLISSNWAGEPLVSYEKVLTSTSAGHGRPQGSIAEQSWMRKSTPTDGKRRLRTRLGSGSSLPRSCPLGTTPFGRIVTIHLAEEIFAQRLRASANSGSTGVPRPRAQISMAFVRCCQDQVRWLKLFDHAQDQRDARPISPARSHGPDSVANNLVIALVTRAAQHSRLLDLTTELSNEIKSRTLCVVTFVPAFRKKRM